MPVRDLHLKGRLVRGPYGLVLQAGGGHWDLDGAAHARRLIGREVEVRGSRAGFNGIICDQIWLAGAPRPRRLRLPIERLLVGGLVLYGMAASAIGLARYIP